MIDIKTKNEVKKMAEGGRILAEVLFEVLKQVKPGISELELDQLVEKLIREKNAEPGFKRVKGYSHSICVSTNDVVVHGVPTSYRLKEGDVIGIDCGVYYKGFNTDMAETIRVVRGPVRSFPPVSAPASLASLRTQMRAVGSPSTSATPHSHVDRFLSTGKRALGEAIEQARVGNRVGHISKIIQRMIEGAGYSVVRTLVGHGVGRKLHEEPEVPGFLAGSISKTPLLLEGMTLAIEVIYNMGKPDVVYANSDGWTIKTKDGSFSAVFERTIAVIKEGALVLTS